MNLILYKYIDGHYIKSYDDKQVLPIVFFFIDSAQNKCLRLMYKIYRFKEQMSSGVWIFYSSFLYEMEDTQLLPKAPHVNVLSQRTDAHGAFSISQWHENCNFRLWSVCQTRKDL